MNPVDDNTIQGVLIEAIDFYRDERGWLAELFRHDESVCRSVMAYVSETRPGKSRGPHEHRDQTDLFVFFGPGDLQLCLWDARLGSLTYQNKLSLVVGGSNPCRVVVPPGVVHGYRNVSEHGALVFNAPDRLFAGHGRAETVDEIRHETDPETPYRFF